MKRFTEAEIAELRKLGVEGRSLRQISKAMGRPISSVRIKLIELAIKDDVAEVGEGTFRYDGWRPTWVPT